MLDLDYNIIKKLHRTKEPLKVGELSKDLDLPHSTIGSSVKRLEEEGYVIYERYKPVKLSKKGIDLAYELIRHAKLLELLLYNELGLTAEEAHLESEKFHLLFSCNTINRICEKYGHPHKGACGELIFKSNNCSCDNMNK